MAKYTSPNQYANMLEKRAQELEAIADGLRECQGAFLPEADALDDVADRALAISRAVRQAERERKGRAAA